MDSLTQAVVGAAMGELFLGKKLGNRAIAWGALFGTFPDLDVLAFPFLDTAGKLAFHRGASHSLLVMVFAAWALGPLLASRWKKEKISSKLASLFVFMAWSTHVLIDCFNVYGTSVWWPFSESRISLNYLFIIDPLYTSPMLAALMWILFLNKPKQLPRRRRIHTWGLAISCCYLAFAIHAKHLATQHFKKDLTHQNIQYSRMMAAPTPLNTLLWRAVVDREEDILIAYYSLLDSPKKSLTWIVYPKHKNALEAFKQESEIKIINWFSDGWWIARSNVDRVWIADLRFGENRELNPKQNHTNHHFMFSWEFFPNSKKDRLQQIARKPIQLSSSLSLLKRRIFSDDPQWYLTPRLAGVPGKLPEFLDVISPN